MYQKGSTCTPEPLSFIENIESKQGPRSASRRRRGPRFSLIPHPLAGANQTSYPYSKRFTDASKEDLR